MHTANPTNFPTLWADALTANDRDAYISDWTLLSIWGDDSDAEIPQERIDYFTQIWDAAHMSIKDICKAAGLTQLQLGERYGISRRTIGHWCTGENACPHYTRLLILLDLGLVTR